MRRLLLATCALALVASGLTVAAAAPAPVTGLLAGAGVADATWHIGASAGQYASSQEASVSEEWDPNFQHVKNASSYGVASRLSMRAIVLQSPGQPPVALIKNDNYLSQDMLIRRAGQILAESGSKVTYENLLVSATHAHSSPYYSTPAAGVWVFQDVVDLRMFEYQARAMAKAVQIAEKAMRPAKLGATTVQFPDFQGNIAGAAVSEDGSPAGYPLQENDHGLTVIRIDDLKGKSIGTYVNYAQHGESLETSDLISADWVSPFQRYVDRITGAPVVFSQGAVGSAEGPYENAYPIGKAPVIRDGGDPMYAIYGHLGFAQAERGGHLMASRVIQAWEALGRGQGQARMSSNPVVKMVTDWVAGPLSHPYPAVSNCRTNRTIDGNPGVPVAGFPDCQRAADAFGQSLPADGLDAALRSTGLPIPSSYDAASFGAVEENARIKLQVVRIGEVVLASCACEAQSDLIKALETRIDNVRGNRWDGFDFASPIAVAAGWPGLKVRPCFAVRGGQSCPDPRDKTGKARLTVPKAAFDRMQAQIHNNADGWDDPSSVVASQGEPADPKQIKGNFTHRELAPGCGYQVPVALGHTGDYNGYTVSYREFMARDSYRKALTSYGPHTADYMVTHLMALAANLKCGTPVPPSTTDALALVDEQRQNAEAIALGKLSSFYLDAWDAQIPDNAGPASAITQPKSITRFNAATFRWVGGDNWTDNPNVIVQRRMANGSWAIYGNQDGEVQTRLDQPPGVAEAVVDHRAGAQRWTWTAQFEAFDSFPRADVPGGQVPNGTYRFVVDGKIHTDGASKPYRLESQPFTVSPWKGLTGALQQRGGKAVFTPAPIAYPRSYASPFPFIRDDNGGITRGGSDTNNSVLCKSCTFRPWAAKGSVARVVFTVVDRKGKTRLLTARFSAGRWVADLRPGDSVRIAPGGLRDSYGETNGTTLTPSRGAS